MDEAKGAGRMFEAPKTYWVLFYLLLLAWTVGTLPVVYAKFKAIGFGSVWVYASMIGFVYAYTWFWCLGIFYRISLDDQGAVVLRSLRRELRVEARQIASIEGSRFPGGFGFLKLKVPRETGYLFCLRRTPELETLLQGLRKANPRLTGVRI
jgi:hypothetical protein